MLWLFLLVGEGMFCVNKIWRVIEKADTQEWVESRVVVVMMLGTFRLDYYKSLFLNNRRFLWLFIGF